jgi:hypothetical protein
MTDFDHSIADGPSTQWAETTETHPLDVSAEAPVPTRPSPDTDYRPEAKSHSKPAPKRPARPKSKATAARRQPASKGV